MTKTMKKLFAVLVSAALLISCFAFTGNADSPWTGAPTGDEMLSIGLTLDKAEANPGDTVTVTVRIANNYNATTMRWPVLYSKDFFEIDGDGSFTAPINTVVSVPGSTITSTGSGFIPAAYVDDYDAFNIHWVAGSDLAAGVGAFHSAEAVDCFTFNLKVKENATGSGSVFIPENSTAFYYAGINDPTDGLTSYSTDVPFTFVIGAPQSVAVLSAAEPVLSAADGFDVCVMQFDDDDTEYLVGFNVEEVLDNGGDFCDQFVVTDGTYEVEDDILRTGNTVTIYDSNGDEFKTYTIIMFGDVDCDGSIESLDADEVVYMFEFATEPELINIYAADTDPIDETIVDLGSIDIIDHDQIIYFFEFAIARDGISQTHTPA